MHKYLLSMVVLFTKYVLNVKYFESFYFSPFTFLHIVLFVAAMNVSRLKDVVLGEVKIPLANFIHKRTGMLGS